jgi:hypothetical protein
MGRANCAGNAFLILFNLVPVPRLDDARAWLAFVWHEKKRKFFVVENNRANSVTYQRQQRRKIFTRV